MTFHPCVPPPEGQVHITWIKRLSAERLALVSGTLPLRHVGQGIVLAGPLNV